MFYGDGLPEDVIRNDLSYCLALAGRTDWGPNAYDNTYRGPDMGIAGAIIAPLVGGIMNGASRRNDRHRRQSVSMRNCMGLHGYSRYAISEADWNVMFGDGPTLDRMIAFMTGPTPTTERLPQ